MWRQVLGLLVMGCLSICVGCSEKKPSVPEIFKTQLMKFLEEGAKINAMSGQGVSYGELRDQLASVKAAYDLVKITWPPTLPKDMTADFDRAIRAWDLTLHLWKLKIGEKDEPTEPDINGFAKHQGEFKNELIFRTHDYSYVVDSYRGKQYLPFDDNISALLTVAGMSFNDGRSKIFAGLQ